MDFMTLREASEKMGCDPSTGKLLLRWWPYSRRCKDGNNLTDPERRGKARGYENKAREKKE